MMQLQGYNYILTKKKKLGILCIGNVFHIDMKLNYVCFL